jgi:hypothetical protein
MSRISNERKNTTSSDGQTYTKAANLGCPPQARKETRNGPRRPRLTIPITLLDSAKCHDLTQQNLFADI